MHNVIKEIISISKELSFHDIDLSTLRELLDSHSENLSNDDLVEFQQQIDHEEERLNKRV